MAASYDCQSCGACCATYDVLLMGTDLDRFEADPSLLALTTPYEKLAGVQARFMRREAATGRCVALRGPLHACACSIYADRPMLCRELEVGSPHCLAAREAFGLPL